MAAQAALALTVNNGAGPMGSRDAITFTKDQTVPNRGLRAANRYFWEKMQLPERWTTAEVAANLWQIGLGRYAPTFVENGVDGKNLGSVDVRMLQNMGVAAAHRNVFFEWVSELPKLRRAPKAPEATATFKAKAPPIPSKRPSDRLFQDSLVKSWKRPEEPGAQKSLAPREARRPEEPGAQKSLAPREPPRRRPSILKVFPS
jgi:hypothetical protein